MFALLFTSCAIENEDDRKLKKRLRVLELIELILLFLNTFKINDSLILKVFREYNKDSLTIKDNYSICNTTSNNNLDKKVQLNYIYTKIAINEDIRQYNNKDLEVSLLEKERDALLYFKIKYTESATSLEYFSVLKYDMKRKELKIVLLPDDELIINITFLPNENLFLVYTLTDQFANTPSKKVKEGNGIFTFIPN